MTARVFAMVSVERLSTIIGMGVAVWAGVYGAAVVLENLMLRSRKFAIAGWLQHHARDAGLFYKAQFAVHFKFIFDQIFGDRHLTVRCFARACIGSISCVLLVSMLWSVARPEQALGYWSAISSDPAIPLLSLTTIIMYNLTIDYISLLETRYIIEKMSRSKRLSVVMMFIALDAILTAALSVIFLISCLYFLFDYLDTLIAFRKLSGLFVSDAFTLNGFYSFGIDLSAPWDGRWGLLTLPSLGIFLYSTFLTSVLLWLYAAGTWIVRGAALAGVRLLSWNLDISRHPVQCIGVVVGGLLCVVVWIIIAASSSP